MITSPLRSFIPILQPLSISLQNIAKRNHDIFPSCFVFVHKGTGWLKNNSGKQTIHDNCLLWLPRNEDWEISLQPDAKGYQCSFQNFSNSFLNYDPAIIYHPQFHQLLTASTCISINVETSHLFNMILKTINNELERSSIFSTEIIQRYFKIFVVQLLRVMDTVEQRRTEACQSKIFQQFQTLLEKNFTQKKKVADYATEMLVSANYLNGIVRRLTGSPVSYHIRQRIVLEAKRMAAKTDMCMKEVAYELGFEDITRFSKYFRATAGINFTDFKQQIYLVPMAG